MSNEASILYLFYLLLVVFIYLLFSQVASRQVDVPTEFIRSILCSNDIVKIMLQHIYPLFLFWFWYSSCFDVKCWFHTFPNRCSHISMGVLILLDHQDGHVKSFSTGVPSLQVIPYGRRWEIWRFVCFIHPKLSLFSPPSHPSSSWSKKFSDEISILFMWCFFILFLQCSYPVIYREDAQELQVHHSFVLKFCRWM